MVKAVKSVRCRQQVLSLGEPISAITHKNGPLEGRPVIQCLDWQAVKKPQQTYPPAASSSPFLRPPTKMSPTKILKSAAFLTLLALTILATVVIVRTILFTPTEADLYCTVVNSGKPTSAGHKAITADSGIVQRFQQALRFRTITKAPKDYNPNETHRFIHFLQTSKFDSAAADCNIILITPYLFVYILITLTNMIAVNALIYFAMVVRL